MPIYAYRCSSCGHQKDVLQKVSDPMLSVCPACGASSFAKQITAAGFQLKGSGWYATDFRNNGSAGKSTSAPAGGGGDAAPVPTGGDAASSGGEPKAAAASSGPCGGSCACH